MEFHNRGIQINQIGSGGIAMKTGMRIRGGICGLIVGLLLNYLNSLPAYSQMNEIVKLVLAGLMGAGVWWLLAYLSSLKNGKEKDM